MGGELEACGKPKGTLLSFPMDAAIVASLSEERRTVRLALRLTPGDAKALDNRARAAGLSRAQCGRALVRAALRDRLELAAA